MAVKILIMGLPGAGKTTLAVSLREKILQEGYSVAWLNADTVRREYNDWDFSDDGRIRQSVRMCKLASAATEDYVIADFVAALPIQRIEFGADWTIWVDTISESIYENTNKAFVVPEMYNFHVTEKDAERWSEVITENIIRRSNT